LEVFVIKNPVISPVPDAAWAVVIVAGVVLDHVKVVPGTILESTMVDELVAEQIRWLLFVAETSGIGSTVTVTGLEITGSHPDPVAVRLHLY
jgi:hypothetical protein